MDNTIIRFENVTKSYDDGTVVLKNVSFELERGKFYTLLGPSGCGKTTILRIIAGFTDATTGDVYFNDKRINNVPANERQVNTVFQDYALFPHLNVFENVAFGLRIKKIKEDEIRERVLEALKFVNLAGYGNREISEMSGGQRQRIGIARALSLDPSFIIADEPISALDVSIQAQVVNLLKQLQKERGLTYLFIAHDLSMVKYISDRIAVMYRGRILELGEADEIYNNPIHPYTKSLLSAVPQPNPEYERNRVRIPYKHEEIPENAEVLEARPGHFVLATKEQLSKWMNA